MSDKENDIIYTARDIEQYLAGNLSPQQMHAMEKAALDDPFLAEAMEGYEVVKDKEWNNQLVAIREELNNKGTVAKVIPLHKSKNNWWKAAAAVLIIGSGATLTFILSQDKEGETIKQEIAQNIPGIKDSITQIEIPSPASVTQSLNPSASASEQEKKAIPGTIAKLDEAGSKTESNIILEPGAPVIKAAAPLASGETTVDDKAVVSAPAANSNTASEKADVVKEMSAEKNKPAGKQTDDADELAGRQKIQPAAPNKKEAVLNNFFTAQVVTADNTPLPFTNISIKKENFGTYADAKGMVRLVSTDSILYVEVKSVGYQPKTFALRNNQVQTKIILQEEEAAPKDQTVVVGYGTRKAATQNTRRATLLKDSVVNVEPADGWDNYNTYVANNLDIPESALKNDRHGEVELTFDVKANGTISNIKVNKSLGAEYDEAAKRLLQEGPQWKVKKGKKTSASIKVQF
jgi:TonB family protein